MKTVKRYLGRLRHPVIISFDKRLRRFYGYYSFDGKTHKIVISPWKNKTDERNSELKNLIQTTLHEIRHINQWKKLKSSFWSKRNLADNSPSELDARDFEEKYIDDALTFYRKCKDQGR